MLLVVDVLMTFAVILKLDMILFMRQLSVQYLNFGPERMM